MSKMGIRSITKKKYRPYPSKEKVIQLENLLKRDFTTETINKKWAADITYIHTLNDGWCYLAPVLALTPETFTVRRPEKVFESLTKVTSTTLSDRT